jgi:hypothetical protein
MRREKTPRLPIWKSYCDAQYPKCRSAFRIGSFFEQILSEAVELKAGLIVMASHCYGWFDRLIHGSDAEAVARFWARLFAINSSRIPPQHKPPSGAKSGLGRERNQCFERRAPLNNTRSRRESLFDSSRTSCSPSTVILKGDGKASIRVWEKLMKRGEFDDLS